MNKRSRQEEDNAIAGGSTSNNYYEVFRKSKRILRSPEQSKKDKEETKQQETKHSIVGKNEEMEDMREMIKEILHEVKTTIPELKNEIRELKNELKQREEKWEKERSALEKRIENLEARAESEEKEKRKNNIIIKGLQLGTGEVTEEVKGFLNKELHVNTCIQKAYKVGKDNKTGFIVAEIESWNKKQEIMKAKTILRNREIYIDHDLTYDERRIQREIRNIAKEERKKNPKIKVVIGYKKMIRDGVLFLWDEKENGLSESEITQAKNY